MRLMTAALGLIVLAGTATLTSAQTRSTGWIELSEWEMLARSLYDTDQIPVKARCKDKDTKELSHRSGMANVTIAWNTNNLKWRGHAGNDVAMVGRQFERQGFRIVSHSQYRRKSGLVIRCAIWHSQ